MISTLPVANETTPIVALAGSNESRVGITVRSAPRAPGSTAGNMCRKSPARNRAPSRAVPRRRVT